MLSTTLMWAMVCFYIIMIIVTLVEGKVGLAVYWIGAAVLTLGLLIMSSS